MSLGVLETDRAQFIIGATYARVSTMKQKDGISLEQQEGEMLTYANLQTIEVPQTYRFREQVSGYDEVREYYDEIRVLVRSGKINVLIVYSSDRYVRDPIIGDVFRAELRRAGVKLHIVSEGGLVDIETESGQFVRRLMDNFNWYWGRMVVKTMADKKRAYVAAGIPGVYGAVRFGFKRVGNKDKAYLEHVDEEKEIVTRLYRWKDADMPVTEMARMLRGTATPGERTQQKRPKWLRPKGEWTVEMIYKILRDPIYRGVYYANKTDQVEDINGRKRRIPRPIEKQTPINVPAIVDDALWWRVNNKLDEGLRGGLFNAKHDYLLSRRIVCRHCGAAISGQHHKYSYYRCNRTFSPLYAKKGCEFKPKRIEQIDEAVWNKVVEIMSDLRALYTLLTTSQREQAKLVEKTDSHIESVELTIKDKEKRLKNFTSALADEYGRETKNDLAIAALRTQMDQIANDLKELYLQRDQKIAQRGEIVITDGYIDHIMDIAEEYAGTYDKMDFMQRRALLDDIKVHVELEQHPDDPNYVDVHVMIFVYDYTVTEFIEDGRKTRYRATEQAREARGHHAAMLPVGDRYGLEKDRTVSSISGHMDATTVATHCHI